MDIKRYRLYMTLQDIEELLKNHMNDFSTTMQSFKKPLEKAQRDTNFSQIFAATPISPFPSMKLVEIPSNRLEGLESHPYLSEVINL